MLRKIQYLAKKDSFIMEIDASGKVIKWTDLASCLFGYDTSDVLNSYLPLIPDRVFHEFLNAKNKAIKGETPEAITTKRMLEDGVMVEADFLCHLFSEDSDKRNSIRFSLKSIKKIKNISKNSKPDNGKKKDKPLTKPEKTIEKTVGGEFLDGILNNFPGSVILIDNSGEIELLNKKCETFTGYRTKDLQRKYVTSLFQTNAGNDQNIFKSITNRANPQPFKAAIITKSEEAIQVEVVPAVNRSEAGEITGYLLVLKDITEDLQKDELINYLRDYIEYTIESLGDAVITARVDNTIIYWNRGAEEMFGYSSAEAIGKNILMVLSGAKDITDANNSKNQDVAGSLLAYLKTNNLDKSKLSFEEMLIRKNGESFPAMVSVSVPKDSKGLPIIGNVMLIKDITDRKKLEQQLLHSEKLASLGSMISGITHELNNKLAPILGYAQIIKGMEVDGEISEMISKIETSAKGAKNIIHALLGFARHNKPDFNPVDINRILSRVVNLFKYKLDASNIKLKTSYDKKISRTMADENQIEQVFVNIINNALQAMDAMEGTIEVTSNRNNGMVCIEISDNGPGIGEVNLKRIFDPFFTTKEPSIGTGLGLSVCYGIINNHNGRISVESKPNIRTTFLIELPLIEVSQEIDEQKYDSAIHKFKCEKKKILIIDDDPMIRDLIESVLKKNHYVDLANAGDSAMDLLKDKSYDLIISDLRMPGIDGFKLYELLKENLSGMEKKIIFTTGDTYDLKTKQFIEKTGATCLAKPFNIDDLIEQINNFFS